MRKKNEKQIRSKMVDAQGKLESTAQLMTGQSMQNDVVTLLSCCCRDYAKERTWSSPCPLGLTHVTSMSRRS